MPANEGSKSVRVLLIEDDPDDAELTMAALGEIQSFRCLGERAGTLSQGLVRLSQGGIDILLLDLGLPDSLGLHTFELAYGQNPDVPMIILSGLADEELAARIVKEGAQDYLVKGKFDGHLLARAIRYAIERHKNKAELRSLSLTDELTGLYNRRGFLTLAEQQVKIANRLRKRLLLIYADMDNLKWINDTLGHKEGDQALKDLADLLNHTFRASDLIARIGGDEFAVLGLEESVADFKKIRTRLQQKAGSRKETSEKPYRLSFSMGFVQYDPEKAEGIDELLSMADRLMYDEKTLKKAKEKGRK
jgi:two-component system, cell cycle response regulator